MSHQSQSERDQNLVDLMTKAPVLASKVGHLERLRETGSEGIERVKRHVMHGTLDGVGAGGWAKKLIVNGFVVNLTLTGLYQ